MTQRFEAGAGVSAGPRSGPPVWRESQGGPSLVCNLPSTVLQYEYFPNTISVFLYSVFESFESYKL